jgi:hypothetical protein
MLERGLKLDATSLNMRFDGTTHPNTQFDDTRPNPQFEVTWPNPRFDDTQSNL